MLLNGGKIREELHVSENEIVVHKVQNVAPIIEDVHRRASSAKDNKDMYYVGSIPLLDYYRILREAKGDRDKERQLMLMFFQQNSKFSTGVKGL